MNPVELVLARLPDAKPRGKGWRALCPAHNDHDPSLDVDEGDDGRALLKCRAGCQQEQIVAALGLTMADLFARRNGGGEGGRSIPPKTPATAQQSPKRRDRQSVKSPQTVAAPNARVQQSPTGLTLAQYAEAKQLRVDFLRSLGLRDMSYLGSPAVRIPYLDADGTEHAVRFRLALAGEDRFRWKSGAKPCLYGLWRLQGPRQRGHLTLIPERPESIVLVEGESDCHTLWYYDIPALGLPGANQWREDRDAMHLEGFETIYLLDEGDQGAAAVREWLGRSQIRRRVRWVRLEEVKDPSELHLTHPGQFMRRWEAALEAAIPWTEQAEAEAQTRSQTAWAQCETLAKRSRILDDFAEALSSRVAGEARVGKLLYLCVTTRLFVRPVSAAVKGPSSAGKSYLLERVLEFFPPDVYHALSAMSERALAYSEEPLAHRFLVIYEAAGLQGEFASYLVRSLLSEGRVRYETVEKTKNGLKPKVIEREGPTGLLVTTTAVKLHHENETRLFSIPVTDTPAQTRAILMALAEGGGHAVDVTPWYALQTWLAGAEQRVVIPYAKALAEAIQPLAVRLRRDFGAILSLIRAHALLHQATREKDAAGCIVATLDDYAVVRELVADLVAEGVEATVPVIIRETVSTVKTLCTTQETTSVSAVARALKIDRSAASRRVEVALERGYLRNLEDRRGRPFKLVLGDPLPAEVDIIPGVDALLRCCTGAHGTCHSQDGTKPL